MKAKCLFLTGLPCSGKTTIAKDLEKYFPNSILLDGDVIRGTPISKDVGFSKEDRAKHILRMGWIAKMFVNSGVTAICSFVSPDRQIRDEIRTFFENDQFVEIFVDAELKECIKRDVKGMYSLAMSGKIKDFTGIGAPYEKPLKPEITLKTSDPDRTIQNDIFDILTYLKYFEKRERAIYIGRWNGVYHLGHESIINQSLDQGKDVLMLIRDVVPDDKNPWTAKEVKAMLDFRYKDNPKVETLIIPDLTSIEYGRKVGYQVNEIKVEKNIAGISGTETRKMIADKNNDWHNFVHPIIKEYLTEVKNV